MLSLFGCFAPKYRVDYDGKKDSFRGAKDAYRAGTKVTLYYGLIATDTDYTFTLDGAELFQDYSERKGFILRFTMPDHDVKLTVSSKNTMVVETGAETVLRFSSFDGGGPEYDAEIGDAAILSVLQRREYNDPDHDQLDGAPYNVLFSFFGLRPGVTAVTISSYSPIDGESETLVYTAEVDDALNVTLTQRDAAEDTAPDA